MARSLYRCKTCLHLTVRAINPANGRKGLYAYHKEQLTGECVPHFDAAHVCAGGTGMTEQVVRRIVQEEMLGLNPKASEEAKSAGLAEDVKEAMEEAIEDDEDGETSSDAPTVGPSASVDPAELARIAKMEVERFASMMESRLVGMIESRIKPIEKRIVVVLNADGTQSELPKDEHTHPLLPRLLRYIAAGRNVYLYGAPGGGKSFAAEQCSRALSRYYGYIPLGPMTPESRIFGFINMSGVYVETEFYKCYTEGGVFCIDEMDNANDAMLTMLNGALEGQRCSFPCGNRDRHPNFVLVSTGNTAGYGGTRGHAGRRAFDAATRERFAYIRWTYDEAFEQALTLGKNTAAGAWLNWVREVRSYITAHSLDVVVSPRAAIVGADMLKKGAVESAEELADAVLFKGLEEVQRAKVLSACPLPRLEVR